MKNGFKQHLISISILFFLNASPVFANVTSDYFKQSHWHPILALTTGAAFTSDAGESTNIPRNNQIFSFYNYSASDANQTQPLLGAFLGAEFLLNPVWSLQTGLGYYQPFKFDAKGIVTQGVDVPTQNQYAYQYTIQSRQLLIENKLLYRWHHYHPYLSAGVGVSFNNVQDYTVNIQPPFSTFSNQFANNSTTSFTYSVGLGIDMDMSERVRMGVGYRFADLGKATTGTSMIDTIATSNVLSQSHFYTNEALVQLTYILI